ncbi:MAG TPA: hypothetical protein VGB17_13350 [Pyrinomonadaceae bacterium]
MMKSAAASGRFGRLAQFLVAKSIIEALFVIFLAVGFYLAAFPPFVRGVLDEANAERIKGWVVDQSRPQARLEVQLYIDNHFVASRTADSPRPDVLAAGLTRDALHGFSFETPELTPGEHEARVYAVHVSAAGARRTLQLVGRPARFIVKP